MARVSGHRQGFLTPLLCCWYRRADDDRYKGLTLLPTTVLTVNVGIFTLNIVYALQALRQALSDLWHESLFIVVTGLLGGFFGLVLLTIPLVLSAHYHAMLRLSEQRVVSVRDWLRLGYRELRFFTAWTLLVLLVAVILIISSLFYLQLGAAWSTPLGWVMVGLFLTWILPQPFVPAFYLQQEDRRLSVALRNTAALLATDPLSIVVLWLAIAFLALPVAYFAWPMLPALIPLLALISIRIVRGYVRRG